jgi:glyoxylase-like metal-dependent hydrolase (beta-lactamase superfamily II)
VDAATITKFSVSTMDNNVYLLSCRATGRQLLIDAAAEANRIVEAVGPRGLSTIVTTHQHWDHVRALATVAKRTGARSLAHTDDADEIPVVDDTLRDGDTIDCGEFSLEVIHLVGHTPGAIALLYRDSGGDHLFTGDSLFPGGPGKTNSPKDFRSLMTDLETKVFGRLADNTWVYPGHGDDTTLGAERPHLKEWWDRGW